MTRDDDAIMDLLARDGARLHGLLYRLTLRRDAAEDLMQELFLRLRTAPTFAAARDRRAYAFRAAINLAAAWRRRQHPVVTATDDATACDDPAARLIRREDCERVLDALPRVGRAARAAFVLRFIEDQSYDDVAAALRTTPHQARALCQKAVRRIRDILNVNPRAAAEVKP